MAEATSHGRFKGKSAATRGTYPIVPVYQSIVNFLTSYPDKTRGIFNEGGLFGERKGWHLPGFDTTSWHTRDLSAGLPDGHAGAGFFVTTFKLDIPTGYDVPISFVFDNVAQPYRALLFVNGWHFGKRVANLGSVVPPGVASDASC
jgi:hypothetical protein